jgi:hypothetical protein
MAKPGQTCPDWCRSASMGHFDQCANAEENESPQTYGSDKNGYV